MKKANILGAIAGDVIGSIYEFNPTKDYHFNMFDERMEYTDDSIMTIAVADWLLNSPKLDRISLAKTMREWGERIQVSHGRVWRLIHCMVIP